MDESEFDEILMPDGSTVRIHGRNGVSSTHPTRERVVETRYERKARTPKLQSERKVAMKRR